MAGLRYVYAVCRPFDTPLQSQLTGVAGAPPGLLRHRGLVAVVSTVPGTDFGEEAFQAHLEDPVWLAATVRAHRGVIAALATVTTPLPLRLGTVCEDDSVVRTLLETHEDSFERVLDRLEGRVEWGVKVYTEPAAAPRPAREPASAAEPEQAPEQAQGEAPGEAFVRMLHERLAGRAEACRVRVPACTPSDHAPRNVLDAAYLVPRAHCEEFVELIDRTRAEEPGVRVELTGPWAAYSFTGEETRYSFTGEDPR
ncbi:gas vesicle protein [Streptomyces sp. MUSC 14]|uniref:GvpL/GvpF family gas vesicle protein n=1 Tax=Streptomyces sp. MUSC 14 TaxID=1354889 RepID=UPI0008F5AA18|nr:GvpL/GvpF family gas vesicle protein [Streptomyces sp. MUSC 14]OIJ97467.1 gas vesicle protein [Streptomyces sp. MUSC 14]